MAGVTKQTSWKVNRILRYQSKDVKKRHHINVFEKKKLRYCSIYIPHVTQYRIQNKLKFKFSFTCLRNHYHNDPQSWGVLEFRKCFVFVLYPPPQREREREREKDASSFFKEKSIKNNFFLLIFLKSFLFCTILRAAGVVCVYMGLQLYFVDNDNTIYPLSPLL